MKINELFEDYGADSFHKIQAIFSSIFILQNRIQTAGEKIQTEISMKQWLLLAKTNYCKEPKTLTNVATLMGCSRQNVKKLSVALEKKGFVNLVSGSNNSVQIKLTEKAIKYAEEMSTRHNQTLSLLFQDFTQEEIDKLFEFYSKLYVGIERLEDYAREIEK